MKLKTLHENLLKQFLSYLTMTTHKGKVIQFRRGRKTVHERHFLIDVGAKNKEEAEKFIGKKVTWKSPAGKTIRGEIRSAHGNKGIVRAIFEIGLPGQAITQEVEVK